MRYASLFSENERYTPTAQRAVLAHAGRDTITRLGFGDKTRIDVAVGIP